MPKTVRKPTKIVVAELRQPVEPGEEWKGEPSPLPLHIHVVRKGEVGVRSGREHKSLLV